MTTRVKFSFKEIFLYQTVTYFFLKLTLENNKPKVTTNLTLGKYILL